MKIGPFEILETLGGGGSGIVYKARHETLGRIVAVKQLNRQVQEGDRTFERFRREAQIMASIRSDHVVTLYSYQVLDGRPLLEMECLENGSLENVMRAGPIELGAAMEIVEDILLGLKSLHGAGIVHRDIKPANVLQDEMGRFKLSDFGLSVLESDAKPTLEAATIRYVAPECISETPSCDVRSDLYSVGMVLYEGVLGADGFRDAFPDLTPAAAFGAKWLSWLKDRTREAIPLHLVRPEIPVPIAQFAARLMAKDPDLRYASADAALAALAPLAGLRPSRHRTGASAGAHQNNAHFTPAKRRFANTRRYAAMAATLLVLGAAVVLGARLRGVNPAAPRTSDGPPPRERLQATLVTRVVDERGNNLPGVSLTILPGNVLAKSDRQGTFVFDRLAPGTYELTSSTTGRLIDVRTVRLEADRTAEETVTLHPDDFGKAPQEPEQTVHSGQAAAGPAAASHVAPSRETVVPSIPSPPDRPHSQTGTTVPTRESPPSGGTLTAQPLTNTDLSRALAVRLGELIRQKKVTGAGVVRVSLTMSTRPSPFTGRGITADYVVTVQTSAGTKSFQGQLLGFAELTLRSEVLERATSEVAASLGARNQ